MFNHVVDFRTTLHKRTGIVRPRGLVEDSLGLLGLESLLRGQEVDGETVPVHGGHVGNAEGKQIDMLKYSYQVLYSNLSVYFKTDAHYDATCDPATFYASNLKPTSWFSFKMG